MSGGKQHCDPVLYMTICCSYLVMFLVCRTSGTLFLFYVQIDCVSVCFWVVFIFH